MATLVINVTYADGSILLASDLDAIVNGVESFINVTKINDENIQNGGITASTKLAAGSVSADRIAAGSITTGQISNSAGILGGQIAAATITGSNMVNKTVTAAQIADATITVTQMAANSVNNAQLVDNTIAPTKLQNLSLTAGQLASGAVTPAKRSTAAAAATAFVGGTISTGPTNTSVSATITGSSRPVLVSVSLQHTAGGGTTSLDFADSCNLVLYKGGSALCIIRGSASGPLNVPFDSFQYLDMTGASGSITYDLRSSAAHNIDNNLGSSTMLSVMEL